MTSKAYVCSDERTAMRHAVLAQMEVRPRQNSALQESYKHQTAYIVEWGGSSWSEQSY